MLSYLEILNAMKSEFKQLAEGHYITLPENTEGYVGMAKTHGLCELELDNGYWVNFDLTTNEIV